MSNDNQYEDDEVFDDKPEAAQTGKNGLPVSPTPMPTVHEYAPPVIPPTQPFNLIEEDYEVVEQNISEEEDDSEVLSDANLRLEQGSLYKLIMKHDLFEGSEADPKAIQNVQKAIRRFAREQMEIMLGMRQDPQTTVVERLEVDFPFNEKEVTVLKMLARTASKGETDYSDKYAPSVTRTTGPIPVVQEKRNAFNPIGTSKKASPKKKLPAKPSEPLKRSKMESTIDDMANRLADQQVSKEMIKEGLRREFAEHDQLLNRPVTSLTADELIERNRIIDRRRGSQVKSSQALPMPSPEQQASMVENSISTGKTNKLIELALKMPPTKNLNPGT